MSFQDDITKDNWHSLFLSIVTSKTADECMDAMGIFPYNKNNDFSEILKKKQR